MMSETPVESRNEELCDNSNDLEAALQMFGGLRIDERASSSSQSPGPSTSLRSKATQGYLERKKKNNGASKALSAQLSGLQQKPGNENIKSLLQPLTNEGKNGCYLGDMTQLHAFLATSKTRTPTSDTVFRWVILHPEWWEDGNLGVSSKD
jgi:hypothetical protein